MRVGIADFKGEIPRRRSRLLPPSYAEAAVNTRLDDGSLAPFRTALLEKGLDADASTIFLHGETWRAWPGDTSVAQGPVAADRLYVTGDGAPKLIADATTYALALPAPAAAPTLSLLGAADAEPREETLVYAYTYRTSLFEESAPSPVSAKLLWQSGQDVRVAGFSPPVAGRGVSHIRIYRSLTSALGTTDLYFVKEIPVAQAQFDHDIEADPLQEIIATTDYDTPPSGMLGVVSMPNGMMAAFDGRDVLFSEPYAPHAWPRKYRLIVDHDVIGLAAFGSVLAILTRGTPYIAQGTAPENMVMEKVESGLPCLSMRGIVDLGYSAAYPSPDGLVLVSASGAQVVTRGLFTRDQWRALRPETFRAAAFDGRYLFSHDDGTGRRLGIIDLTQEQPFFVRSDFPAEALHHDLERGHLYLLEDGRKIRKWQSDSARPKTYRWRSAEMYTPQPAVFGAVLVEPDHAAARHDDGAVLRVFADGKLKDSIPVTGFPQRLSGNSMHTRWQVEVEGTTPILSIAMAQTMEELVP
jgi:hypothetical protein